MPPTQGNSGALVLEEPFIRVRSAMAIREVTADVQTPFELLRRSHRAAQRQVEKDFTGIQVSSSLTIDLHDC